MRLDVFNSRETPQEDHTKRLESHDKYIMESF